MSEPYREVICTDPVIIVDHFSSDSPLYLLSFDPDLTHDMAIVNIHRVCREVYRDTEGRIKIWCDQVESGLLVIYENPALVFQRKLQQAERRREDPLTRLSRAFLRLLGLPDDEESPEIDDAIGRLTSIICSAKNNTDGKNPVRHISSER